MLSPGKNYSGRLVTGDKVALCNCKLQHTQGCWINGRSLGFIDRLVQSTRKGFHLLRELEEDLVTSILVLALPLECCMSLVKGNYLCALRQRINDNHDSQRPFVGELLPGSFLLPATRLNLIGKHCRSSGTQPVSFLLERTLVTQTVGSVNYWQLTALSLPELSLAQGCCLAQGHVPSPGIAFIQWLLIPGYDGPGFLPQFETTLKHHVGSRAPYGISGGPNFSLCPILLCYCPSPNTPKGRSWNAFQYSFSM